MKFLNFILSIYLVALSCLPCADMEVDSIVHTQTTLKSNHENHSHDKENDLCPPFCSCACCGVQVLTYLPEIAFNFGIVSTIIKKQLPTYKSILSSNFYGSIWQPPQIV
jgi:hypothetical protein